MNDIEKKIQIEAKRLLDEKKVDLVIGYKEGTLPLQTAPVFITSSAEVGKLVFNPYCKQNLAIYAHQAIKGHQKAQERVKPEDKTTMVVAVIARGCTSRSLVIHLQEQQYSREEIVIIGVPCSGYIDKNKLNEKIDGAEVIDGSVSGDSVTVKTAKGEKKLKLNDVLADNCLTCEYNNPVISDFSAGEIASHKSDDEFKSVDEFAALSDDERWAYFSSEMNKCMRCFACRNICPSCYCATCFAEQSQPEWVGAGINPSDNQVFQVMRMFHMAGRCVDCGSCVEVCAEGIDLRKFLKKLDQDDQNLYGHKAGVKLDEPSPLASFRENDGEAFIFEPE
ncbi:4Fe-4S dicluster domain-containing protein [bacterium]|nr:4Fe-4S dicluster domain-containing protein [bacterium]